MYNMNPYYQVPQRTEIPKVSGRDGAMAYALAPNSAALLLDTMNPMVWLKTTDSAGYPSLKCYDITEHKTEENVLNGIVERLEALERRINESDNAGTKRTKSNGADSSN